MKLRNYFLAVLAVMIALGLSATVIYYSAQIKDIHVSLTEPVSFETPVNIADKFTEGDETESVTIEVSLAVDGSIINYFTPVTEETTTEEPSTEAITAEETSAPDEVSTTEETTAAETTTESLVFAPDLSTNYYNDSSFVTVDTDYFDDAIFIGNSRLQGFILYSKVPDLRSYTYVGLSVKTYFSKDAFTIDGQSVTAAQALEMNPDFKKVYLKFGINELGWVSNEQFAEDYRKILDHIYSCNPNAIVFVHSVLPVSQYAIERDPTLSMEKISEYNNVIMDMASEYGACYLDAASIFTGEDGYMPYELSFDGVHLNASSVQLWLNYLLGHGINEN